MKRLIVSLLTTAAIFANVSTVSAFERWEFQMFQPATTTNKSLNIEYKVLSINADDTFAIKLYQNDIEVGAQTVTTDFGDSGIFSITAPGTGTYTYKTTAYNNGDSTEKSETRTIQINNAPQAVTITSTTEGAVSGDTNGDGVVNSADGGRGSTSGSDVAGSTSSTEESGGQVDEGAASTDKNKKDVLGDSDSDKNKKENDSSNNSSQNWGSTFGVIVLLLGIAGGYYYLVMRRANKD